MTPYHKLLAIRHALVAMPGDCGVALRGVDAVIAEMRASDLYTGRSRPVLSPFMQWYCKGTAS